MPQHAWRWISMPPLLTTEDVVRRIAAECAATFTARALPADTAARLISTAGTIETLPNISELLRIVT
jgi:hypothetical protein